LKSSVALAATLFALLLLEAALRGYYHVKGIDIDALKPPSALHPGVGEQGKFFASHPFLPFAQRAGERGSIKYYSPETKRIYVYDYSLNSLGFRTPERPFEKLAGVKRIVVLGGSTTVDGFTDPETWPARLEAKLNESYAADGMRVEVINLGVSGAASPTSLINLEFVGLEFHPDLVISYDGVNDALLVGFEGMAPDYRNAYRHLDDGYRSWQSRLPGWAFRSYLVTRLSHALDAGGGGSDLLSRVLTTNRLKPSGDIVAGIPLFERNLRLQRTLSNGYGARYFAATPHWLAPDRKVAAMNDELRRFFAHEGIDYVDLDALLPHDDWSLHVDNVHWTREGTERVAEEMQKKIVAGNLLGIR
jgi:lysophospholipase L1-like esterase